MDSKSIQILLLFVPLVMSNGDAAERNDKLGDQYSAFLPAPRFNRPSSLFGGRYRQQDLTAFTPQRHNTRVYTPEDGTEIRPVDKSSKKISTVAELVMISNMKKFFADMTRILKNY